MKNISIKNYVISFAVISAIAWIILACLSGKDSSQIKDFLSLVPTAIIIDVVILAAFAKRVKSKGYGTFFYKTFVLDGLKGDLSCL